MLFSQNASKIICLLLLYYSFSRLHDLVGADPPYPLCSNQSHYADNSSFHHILNNLFSSLSLNSSVSKFYSTYASNNLDRVYGLYMCFGNTTIEVCNRCIITASQDILKHCPNRKEAIIWEEHCQLRYSHTKFFSTLDIIGNQAEGNSMNISESERRRFKDALNITLSRVLKDAAYDPSPDMYAAKKLRYSKSESLYVQAQCTGDLLPNDCNTCLEIAINNASSCCNSSLGARVYSKTCYLRYEVYDFDGGAFEEIQVAEKNSKWKIWVTMIFVVSAFLAVALLGSSVYCLKMKAVSHRGQTKIRWEDIISQEVPLHNIADPNGSEFLYQNFNAGDEQKAMEFPYIDLASIHAATDNFSKSNMLGQGGFGSVYKGKLSDGKEIAVKRLSSCSHQGSEEFTNEVLLIMKLQHKNLVRLLGFCVNGEEKLLVYEYMPNGSLDVFLFDSTKCAQLNWSRRLSIINGIAKGMLYLHEDSRLKVIHRDLKASNILLDSNMDPKISDFGMARIVEGSEGEASTCRLVGTYGYMAPEYAMEGLYSVKSDVFSFGVLLLEIITGKRNAGFHDQSKLSHSLLSYAWQLWNEGKAMELMDPSVAESCCPDEFIKCVYLGLMCVQEDACERPTMSTVMLMLKGGTESSTLRQPDRPAFSWGMSNEYDEINTDSLSFDRLTGSSDIKANEGTNLELQKTSFHSVEYSFSKV